MTRRRILFLVYDGFELLDMAGPATVFTAANELAGRPLYEVLTVAPTEGAVSGIGVTASPISTIRLAQDDTLLVMGAAAGPLRLAMRNPEIIALLTQASREAERFGSVCTGTFILASAGLLAGRTVATHWAGCDQFRRRYPTVNLEPNALYVTDSTLWTSAGVTTGIDMALAILARDHGAALMGRVAKYLVVYAHRPGHQSQFSGVIDAQTQRDGEFARLITWLRENIDQPIPVAAMAARAGMSERTFCRRFAAAVGTTPAKFMETLRLDAARLALEAGDPVKLVAARVAFRSEAAFRSVFTKKTGVSPSHYARMHRP